MNGIRSFVFQDRGAESCGSAIIGQIEKAVVFVMVTVLGVHNGGDRDHTRRNGELDLL